MADRATGRARRSDHVAAPVRTGSGKPKKRVARSSKTARPALRLVRTPLRPRKDPAAITRRNLALLLAPTALLTATGIVMVLSASSVSAYAQYGSSFMFFNRQLAYAGIGILAMFAAARAPYRLWQKLAIPLLAGTVVLLLVALMAGHSANGASRWIGVGPVTFQPSELAKLAILAFGAKVLTAKHKKLHDPGHLLLPLLPVTLLVSAIVILQRDLGTTIVLCGSVSVLLFAAGARAKHLMWTGFAATVAGVALVFGESYRATRFFSFRNPWADPQGAGYQLIQGYIALGSGGWLGVGLGASRQKWQYVPNAHTDFIFAILGEEMGLLGELVVLSLFGILVFAGIRIAMRAPDTFGRLLAAGLTGWIGLQAIVNLGAVTGLLPVTGVPLPFVSYGGSALVASLVGVGVLASIARAGTGTASGKRAVNPKRKGRK